MKRTKHIAAGLAALALAAPATTQAGPLEPTVGEPPTMAELLGQRADAGVRLSTQAERARARGELEVALTKRGTELDKLLANERPAAPAAGDGFAWRAAGFGAGAALALALLVGGVYRAAGSVPRTRSVGRATPTP
jgi:hypothetical protein